MKRYVYFDSGTTNTRLYMIEAGRVLKKYEEKIGTLDNVTSGDSKTLLRGLYRMYQELLQACSLKDDEVHEIYMSGMATSANGVYEVDYLPVPMGRERYKRCISFRKMPLFQREIGFLTGLIDCPYAKIHKRIPGDINNVQLFHNVRGEEIELFGIITMNPHFFHGKSAAVIMPGSHTHILYVEDCIIKGITSCMGGELFAALAGHTILRASVDKMPQNIYEDAVKTGYRMVKMYGVNRAIYMTRAMELFTDESREVRNSYLEGVVNGGIITALLEHTRDKKLDYILIAGAHFYHRIFLSLLNEEGCEIPGVGIAPAAEKSFALAGFISIMKEDEV